MKDFSFSPGLALLYSMLLCAFLISLPQSAGAVTASEIDDLLAAVNTDSSLDKESQALLVVQLDTARAQLELASKFYKNSSDLKAEIEMAPTKAANFEQQLTEAKAKETDFSDLVPDGSNIEDIQSQITLAIAQRKSLGDRRGEILKAVDELPARRAKIKERLALVQQTIDSSQVAASPIGAATDQKVVWALSQARLQAALIEKESLEAEVLGESALSKVNAAERAWLGYALTDADTRLAVLNESLDAARASSNQQQLDSTSELQEQLQSQDPLLQQFAEDNLNLAKLLQDTAEKLEASRRSGQRNQELLEDIEQDSKLMNRRLEAAGRKEVLGRVMITRLDSLPDTASIARNIASRNELIANTSLSQIDIEEDFRALNEGSEYLLQLAPDLEQWDETSKTMVRDLVDQRSQLLEKNLSSLGSLLNRLLDNNDTASELIIATETFHKFLLGNLLWIRNFSYLQPHQLYEQLTIIASPQNWGQLPSQIVSGYKKANWSPIILLALLLIFLAR